MKKFCLCIFLLARATAQVPVKNEQSLYEQASKTLDAGNWKDAAAQFAEIARHKGGHADGALYWEAYALNKLSRRDAALAALEDLRKDFANSKWLNDAKALEMEIHQKAGQPINADADANDDLKMLAMSGLMNSDPDQAIPLFEKILKGGDALKFKEKALFVLSQSYSPKAKKLLSDAAKGAFNSDLQIVALRYMAMAGASSRAELASVYASSNDFALKQSILGDFLMSKFGGPGDPLVEIAKNEKNPTLRSEAIQKLGMIPAGETANILQSIYASSATPEAKRDVISALFLQGNAKVLIDLARKETNAAMKHDLVQKLSLMHSKESAQ